MNRINPRVDIAFKKIFGVEENKDLLNEDSLPSSMDTPTIKKALGVLDVMNFGSEERRIYEEHLKWLRMKASALKKSEQDGIEKGKIEGKAERELEIAKAMLDDGIDIEIISKFTGLSAQKIKDL